MPRSPGQPPWQAIPIINALTGSTCSAYSDSLISYHIMEETGVDAFDSKLLNSIFLLTEGKDIARLRLVCKEWQQKIDDAQVE